MKMFLVMLSVLMVAVSTSPVINRLSAANELSSKVTKLELRVAELESMMDQPAPRPAALSSSAVSFSARNEELKEAVTDLK